MNMLDSFKKVAFIQAILGLVTYAVAEQNSALVLIAGAMGLLSWYVVEGPGGKPLPRWIINAGVIAATCYMIFSQMPPSSQPLILALGKFITAMILFKLYERKSNRDWAQLMVLSLMQMICALLISSEVLFGVLFVMYLILTLIAVLLFQLRVGYDEVVAINEKQTPKHHKAVEPKPLVTRGAKRHFNMLAAVSGLGCIIISIGFFLAMPRGQGVGILGEWDTPTRGAQSGFDTKVELGSSGRIQTSRMPVMNVTVTRGGVTLGPSGLQHPLIRGAVQDRYQPGKGLWSRSQGARDKPINKKKRDENNREIDELEPRSELTDLTIGPQERIIQEYMIRTPTKSAIFSLYPPIAVESDDVKPIKFNPVDQMLQTQQTSGSGTTYIIESLPGVADLNKTYLDKHLNPSLQSGFNWSLYAKGPVLSGPDHTRVEAYANTILSESGLERDPTADSTDHDHQIASVIEAYLQQNYFYTLDLPETGTVDPILAFLFDNRNGHCEYFASGMTALLRSIGLRARMVTGYRAAEFNSIGGYFIIRQKHAHAWVEVWQDGKGWGVYDPSPPATIASLHEPSGGWLLDKFRDIYEYIEYRWIDKIITYDAGQRQTVMVSMDGNLKGFTDALTEIKNSVSGYIVQFQERLNLGIWGYFIIGAFVLMIVAAVGGFVIFIVRRRRAIKQLQLEQVSRKHQRRLARHLEFYLNMLRILERAGFVKPVWQTPASFAEQLDLQNAARFAPVVPLTELFYEIRFGGRPLDQERSRLINQHLELLRNKV